MIYLILVSVFSGAAVTLLLQFLLIYRRSPEPVGRTVQYVKVVPENTLKDYFNSQHVDAGQQQLQLESAAAAAAKPHEAASARQQQQQQEAAAVSGGSPKQAPPPPPPPYSDSSDATKPETCNFLNAIFLFLFRELRDTPVVRHWLTKKIKVEFEELLQTKTAGRLLEGLSLRDISLGNSLPVFKSATLMKPVHVNEDGMPEELNFEVDIEYNGGFHLAIDVELVFGKSAYLFVKMRRVVGRLRLQFTRMPFSHWSFSFLDDPLVDFEVKSQFEGRPLPQLTSIIVNQLKRVIKKKHTLPNYKIRYKPFFPFQVQPPLGSSCDVDLSVQESRLVEGQLRVTLIECSRLFILGSYDRETCVHCTLELSSHQWKEKTRSSIKKTEVIKGPCGSVGMTFRHVPATEGDAVHVSIETVMPNSPAALADLQRGDRLIDIGGVKVTSSVQVPKLLKQAGDRVVVRYERPVRHQTSSLGSLGTHQEGFGQLEETGFVPQPGGYEEDPAPITTLSDISDSKDMDSEFEELVVDSKPSQTVGPNNSTTNTSETKDDLLLTVNQSPKRTVANLASKPLGTISPILNRKLNLVGLQSPLKPQPKESPKPSAHKTGSDPGEGLQRPTVPPPPPPSRPPVPPRPQIRLTSASSETSLLEGLDSVTSTSATITSVMTTTTSCSEKSPEKAPLIGANEDKAGPEKMFVKQAEAKQTTKLTESSDELPVPSTAPSSTKADQAKDKASENLCSTRDSLEDHTIWESPETMFRNQTAQWGKASMVFDVESNHKYLNVALWCKDPFKLGSLLCLGHVSLQLEHVALECMATSSAEYQSTFRLGPPEPKANVSRTALRSLSTHKGFNEKLCYGDITLNFCYLAEVDSECPVGLVEREQERSLHDEDLKEREREQIPSAARDDLTYGAIQLVEVRHNFQDTQFQNPTWCEYCKKKVWTKAASQCMVCAYVCHKKCQDKCLSESPFCLAATERRGADPEAKSTINRATTGLTRHIINTSSRLLNLRQVPKTRLVEQVVDVPGTVEPSPKHTPNTSDNESSDTETYTSGASPSKQPVSSGGSSKLVRKEGGLDDSVFIAVKEIGRDLYRGLPTDERSQKLELMLDKLQQEIDQELEHNNALLLEEREATDARRKALISTALAKSGERLQALTLLMIHYRAGIEDLESVESTSPSEQQGFKGKGEGLEDEALMGTEVYDSDICSPGEPPLLDDISEEQICVEALH
ncbi:PDZ domain-containing protein 8 [Solea senegalensis]|uniref:PDZ domain-containing protein 8 n=1 Tax=Solea senegalensis TaxID=28829 RepID=A0AAV6PMX4_SOLSE|nr:PDZ domain-containing protein 8 [Solea senegalensis]KAG7472943.1 PDZ domain-containing protein 8 [Solea senegalensis]